MTRSDGERVREHHAVRTSSNLPSLKVVLRYGTRCWLCLAPSSPPLEEIEREHPVLESILFYSTYNFLFVVCTDSLRKKRERAS